MANRRAASVAPSASDHTALVAFVWQHLDEINGNGAGKPTEQVLRAATPIAKGTAVEATLRDLVRELPRINKELMESDLSDPEWKDAIPLIARIASFSGSPGDLIGLAKRESSRRGVSTAMKVGMQVGGDLLTDGIDTIYNGEWVVGQYMDPRGYLGALSQGWRNMVEAADQKISGVAQADLVGGAVGAANGARKARAAGLKGKEFAAVVAADAAWGAAMASVSSAGNMF